MSKSNLNKIFRLDNNYLALGTAQEKGAGIGLLLCKEYVEKNGGKIWAESEEGKGSSFYITIPKSEKIMESIPKTKA
jgi:Signal transduction histidine kinase